MICVYDIECFSNFFSVILMNKDDEKVKEFVVFNNRNNIERLFKYLEDVTGLIGFNNLSYDYPLLHYVYVNRKEFKNLKSKEITPLIYEKSQQIINSSYSVIPSWRDKLNISQLDLFKIWHFDNFARKMSLKDVEVAINYPNVEDIPFHHSHKVKQSEVKTIMKYNLNDVKATFELYKLTKGETNVKHLISNYKNQDKIKFRKEISKLYGKNFINFNDVKIGEEINKIYYLDISGRRWEDVKNLRTERDEFLVDDLIPDSISFQTLEMREFLDNIKGRRFNLTDDFEYKIPFGDNTFVLRKGGIHSENNPIIYNNKGGEIIDIDVSSMYPATIINYQYYPKHLGIKWLEGYKKIYNKRIDAKSKGNKLISDCFKLSLNGGGYGKTNSSFSWMYDPLVMFRTTFTGQFSMLMLIEDLFLNGIEIISGNTDGLTCFVKNTDKFRSIYEKWCKKTKYEIEETYYTLFVMRDVNNYLAVKRNNSIKTKGCFDYTKELHKNHSFRIVPYSLVKYFVNNNPVLDTIKNKNNDIFDFCGSYKGNKAFTPQIIKEEDEFIFRCDLQKTNRYYISNNGYKFIKHHNDGRDISIEADWKVTIFNKFKEKPFFDYDINFDYYINECNKIIKLF